MKVNILAFSALLMLCTIACKQENQIAGPSENELQEIRAHLMNTYGFSPESIEETATDFIAEGDQMFSKASYWEDHGKSSDHEYSIGAAPSADGAANDRKHYRYTYLVDKYAWPTIKINVDNTVPESWKSAIVDAVEEWNAADGWFYFQVTYYNYSVNGSVNIKMSGDNIADLTIASCYYPSANRKPGSPMYINPKYNNIAHSRKVFAMVHEIGHALGIRHTDQGQGSLITNVSSACKNSGDGASVMQPIASNWVGFTNCDLEAYWALYGW